MIMCPLCGGKSSVCDTRVADDTIIRRRGCTPCAYRWKTFESAHIPSTVAIRKLRRLMEEFQQQIDALRPPGGPS